MDIVTKLSDLSDHKKIFEYFEKFIDNFSILRYDFFIWMYLLDNRKSKFLYSNNLPSILNVTNSDKNKFKKGLVSFIHEDDIGDYQSRIETLLKSSDNSLLEHQYRIKKSDGTILYIQERIIKSIDKENTVITGFSTDISSCQKAITSLSQKVEQLQEQITSRDKFLSILSHDLRSPFTSIIGFTDILINDNSISDKERVEFLNYIQDSASNQLQFVNYILDWSNLKLGRIQLNLQKVSIADLIYNSISNLTGNSIRKNITIRPNIDDSIYVKVDERLALQAITNLLSNSIKFTPEGKKIHIYSNRFNKDFVEIVIKDEGVGIPEENKTKLFSLDNLYTQRGTKGEKGSGIGLSLVKEIIEKHGGQIWFYSKENEGTEFHFTLPSVDNIILLVEKDQKTAEQIEIMLNDNFPVFKTISCNSAYKSLEVILENVPSIIIINPEFELMDGVEFFHSLKKIIPNFNNPIILILKDSSELKRFESIGLTNYITKPINCNKLRDMISDFALIQSM